MVVFNSLETIIQDILLIYRNNSIAESEQISRLQIEQWIHQYRAFLIKQDIDRGRDINPDYIQSIVSKVIQENPYPGHFQHVTEEEIPKPIDLHYGTGIVAIKDLYGNIIQLGTQSKVKYQRSRQYTCNDYIAYYKQGKIYVEGPDLLEYIEVFLIAEDPTSIPNTEDGCFDPSKPYPMPINMIPTLRQMILERELGIMLRQPSDETNNSSDDLQNIAVKK